MKKVLLATSALVMFAGAASAEIALSGSARMGVVYDSTEGADGEAFFSSRVRIVFTASGETDGGLTFGASMRADQTGGNNSDSGADEDGDSNGDSTVFLSGAFGTITMGDTDGAADNLVGQVSGVGYGPNDSLQEIDFLGQEDTSVYYEYSNGALTFGLGVGQTYNVDGNADTSNAANIGVKYSTDAYSVAIAYETTDFNEAIHLGGSATFGDATVKIRVSNYDNVFIDDLAYALSLDYKFGEAKITGFYTDFTNDVVHYGLGASYSLGGGATVAAGIVRQDNEFADDNTFADVGVKFSF